MKKRILSILLLIVLLVSCTPSSTPPMDSDTELSTMDDTAAPIEEPEDLTIVTDGKSDFAILVDATDPLAKTFATTVQNTIFKTVGVMLPLRSVDELSQYEYKILIGDTGSSESDSLKSKTAENAFSVKTDAKTLTLYANGAQGYVLLEEYFLSTLFVSAQKKEWVIENGSSYCFDPVASASKMTLVEDGSTVYNLVFDTTSTDQWLIATRIATYIQQNTGLKVNAVGDSGKYENEILLGDVNRPTVEYIKKYLSKDGDYLYGVLDGDYIIYSTEAFGIALGVQKLIEAVNAESANTLLLSSTNNQLGNLADCAKTDLYAKAVTFSKGLYGTFSSWVDRQLTKMTQADQADQKLVDALIERMGNSLVVSVGSSSALYQGFVVKLDTVDYGKVTKVTSDQHILIAVDFASRYFGKTLTADSDGYVDITAYCEQSLEYSIYYHASEGIAIVTPKAVTSFENSSQKENGYTNAQYLERMKLFFNNPILPEPSVNVEQSRQEIISNEPDPTYVYDYTTEIYECYASPAILAVGNTLYASHDIIYMSMANNSNTTLAANTSLKKSTDGGKTWTELAFVKDLFYVSLYEYNGKIYLFGNRQSNGYVVVGVYDPTNESFQYADLGFSVMGSAPTAIAVANGRIWRAHNNAVISAPVTSDWLKGESWTRSESPNDVLTKSDYQNATGLNVTGKFWLEEGNIVLGRGGELYAIYRIDASPTWGYAAIFRISDDGKTLTPVASESCVADGIIKFPSGQSKFMIKYDEQTGLYLTFTSLVTNSNTNQRNVLALVASKDLLNWEVVDVVLVEREMMNNTLSMYAHAFQYIDFDFVGDDIVFIVREAFGNACNYHNSNAITLYTLADYASFIRTRLS